MTRELLEIMPNLPKETSGILAVVTTLFFISKIFAGFTDPQFSQWRDPLATWLTGLAVFVDGCFWHRCPPHGTRPRSNTAYWAPKLARNVARSRFPGPYPVGQFEYYEHMLETVESIINVDEIANTFGLDVVIQGNSDLTNFSGWSQTDARYEALLNISHNATLKAGKYWGNAGQQYLTGHRLSPSTRFVQNGPSHDGFAFPSRGRGALERHTRPP